MGTNIKGLCVEEAKQRQKLFGPNALPRSKGRSWIVRILSQFNNVLIYVLMGGALITGLLGDYIDAGVIAGVVIINGIIGFLQEGHAELVPGDIVALQPGDKVGADLRLLRCRDLQIEEASLTGGKCAF